MNGKPQSEEPRPVRHVMLIGQTGSGKTTLAVRLASEYSSRRIPTIVLDPFKDARWPEQSIVTDNPTEFQHIWPTYHDGMLFVDEGGRYMGVNRQSPIEAVATQARHWHHTSHIMAQRTMQLDPNVRGQMNEMALFNVTPYDARILHQEWGYDEILEAPRLRVGEFLWMGRVDAPPERFFIDPRNLNVYTGGAASESTLQAGDRAGAGGRGRSRDAVARPSTVSRPGR